MISYTVYDEEVQRVMDRLMYQLSPVGLSNFLGLEVGPWLRTRASDRFFDEGDDVSGPWAALSEVTQEIRESSTDFSVGGSHPINKRTGELEEYVTGSYARFWPTTMGATVRYPGAPSSKKSLRDKMKTAQEGKIYPRTVPRPVLGVNETDLIFVQTALMFFFSGKYGRDV